LFTVKELQKFVPSVTAADIKRGPAGVRAQAMNSSGDLIGEFIFDSGSTTDSSTDAKNIIQHRVIQCRNAPSPVSTSSLAIGRMMADMMEDRLGLPKNGNAKLY
jgi:2-hydroxyglutarate dehydrogenase